MPKRKASSAPTVTTPSTTLFLNSSKTGKKNPNWADLKFWNGESYLSLRKKMAQVATAEGAAAPIVPSFKEAMKPLVAVRPQDVRVVFLCREPDTGAFSHPDGYAYSDAGKYESLSDMPPKTRALLRAWALDPANKLHPTPKHAILRGWAKQGVLLWNTLPFGQKGEHVRFVGWGWENLTEQILMLAYHQNPNCVFVIPDDIPPLFWKINPDAIKLVLPQFGQWYSGRGDELLLKARPFSKINELLVKNGQMPINWAIK
jgi:uracil DNA glycosylase